MLRISRGSFAPALNTPLTKIWRPVAALTAILAVAVFVGVVVGFVSLVSSRTGTSLQPVSGATNPPVVGDTTERTGIPYVGTGPAADIIRGGYVDETDDTRTVGPDTTVHSEIPYVGTGPAADIIRAGSHTTTERTGIPYVGTGPAADIIRGGYVEEIHPIKASVVRDTGDSSGIPYVGTGPAADAIRSGYDPNGR